MPRPRSLLKVFYVFIALCVLFYSKIYTHMTMDFDVLGFVFGENSRDCHIPDYDPFDSQVLDYLKDPPPIDCGLVQLPLTFMLGDTLHINETAVAQLKRTNSSIKDVECFYYTLYRAKINGTKVSDDVVSFKSPKAFKSGTKIKEELIWVECESIPDAFSVYETGHAIVKPKQKKKSTGRNNTVSVFMMLFDSTSRLNFIRQMPKSHKMLTNELGAIFMKGLNKVGDNTYPNMLVALSGHAQVNIDLQAKEDFSPYWEHRDDLHFDELPIVWKNFSANGYTTLYAEDESSYPMFNYLTYNGFRVPPTDYYPRPLWIALGGKSFEYKNNESRCHGHAPKHEFLLNYTRDFILLMTKEKKPYFAYTHSNTYSHDALNGLKVLDEVFAKYLRDLKNKGAFDNAIVVVMGDHGNRFNDFRATQMGRVEERMPLLAISLPKSLQHMKAQVQENSKILTSWYDFHEFLLDVATGNTQLPSKVLRYGKRGLSFFRSIPANRTCFQIGVPWEYCVCHKEKSISESSSRAKEAARILVQHVNKFIKEMDTNKSCVLPLELEETLNAYSLAPPDEENPKTGYLRVAVSVSPSEAVLEGIVKTDPQNGALSVLGEVNRINRYGNQSACVTDVKLRLYCYCKNYVKDDNDEED